MLVSDVPHQCLVQDLTYRRHQDMLAGEWVRHEGGIGGVHCFSLYPSWQLYPVVIFHLCIPQSLILKGPASWPAAARRWFPQWVLNTFSHRAFFCMVVSVCWNYTVYLRELSWLDIVPVTYKLFLWENALSSNESTYMQTFGLKLFH